MHITLKEDQTYLVLDHNGANDTRAAGLYRRDTRYLRQYHWQLGQALMLQSSDAQGVLTQHYAIINAEREQTVGFKRCLRIRQDGLDDRWEITNFSDNEQTVSLQLMTEGDGRDLFAALMPDVGGESGMTRQATNGKVTFERTAADGVKIGINIDAPGADANLTWALKLPAHRQQTITVRVSLFASDDDALNSSRPALPSYDDWRARCPLTLTQHGEQAVLMQAIDDIRLLLLTTEHGLYPAAGAPWFVTIFGRDAIITSMMLLKWWPEIGEGVLRYLAANIGRTIDPFREEEPGKILHEVRRGEFSRTNKIPFGRYYGSVDSTPLFLMLLDQLTEQRNDSQLLLTLRPQWEAALQWLSAHQENDDGLIAFKPSGSGLVVQSWKDSRASMMHADGSPAEPPLAVAEVQGYAYAAFLAAERFYQRLKEPDTAAAYVQRAHKLAATFHQRYWLPKLNTYAMALDGEGKPLQVLSSDPGHLLWSGIVPAAFAKPLVQTLMSRVLWSGWGLRTLGADEVRYNPTSYHNGSVWPHDTAIFAGGLARYGFATELNIVAQALFDLAAHLPGKRLPELISGTTREVGISPVEYTHACRPQSWSAASIPYVAGLRAS
jgi:glycogen debranching enzyme